MTAPHFHTTSEAIAAIKKIGHNDRTATDGATEGKPTGIKGGSASNITTKTAGITDSEKGGDWVSHHRVQK